MKTGLNKFIVSNQEKIISSQFDRLVTIRNGMITEDISSDSEIYELFVIRLNATSDDVPVDLLSKYMVEYGIICDDNEYSVINKFPGTLDSDFGHLHMINHIKLELTTKDREGLSRCRDSCLV